METVILDSLTLGYCSSKCLLLVFFLLVDGWVGGFLCELLFFSQPKGLPVRVPSAVLTLAKRRRESMAFRTFKQRRCLSDPWFDEPETEPVINGDPEKFKVTDENGVTIGILTEGHRIRAFQFLILINEGTWMK